MTPQEHLFMLTMYARQSVKLNVLLEILKTRGILDADDLAAFLAHVAEETKEHREWFLEAWKTYQSTAASLHITTGLEDFPFPQKSA
jgi:hypothetical protein